MSAAKSDAGTATKLLSCIIFALMLFQMYMSTKVATTPRGTPARELLAQTHYSTGLVLLVLVVARLVIWARRPRAARPAGVPAAADALAGHCNLAYYLTMLAFALSGPVQAWSEGHRIKWYGLFNVPSLLGPSYRWQVAFGYFHSFMGFWILYLTAFTLGVAVYQRLRYGAPLLRMLPGLAWSRG